MMSPGTPIQVKARWSRPAYCRDDWARIRLPNRYCYFTPVDVVEIIDDETCWVRAFFVWDCPDRRSIEVTFTDFNGEGSQDSVGADLVREVPSDAKKR